MSKQEEIREHSEEIVSDCVYGLAKAPMSSEDIVKELFTYLNDNDVKIKVDRELPQNTRVYSMRIVGEPEITRQVQEEIQREIGIYADAQQDMLKAGYVAVEPLIKEKA